MDKGSHITFLHNTDDSSAALYAEKSELYIEADSIATFKNNSGRHSGAILLSESKLNLDGNLSMIFYGNSGSKGGAIALIQKSKLLLNGSACLLFLNNHASVIGGAIYIQGSNYNEAFTQWSFLDGCITAKSSFEITKYSRPYLHFRNNTAILAGSAQYGGTCNLFPYAQHYYFDDSFENDLSLVSSHPIKVCMCIKSKPDCNTQDRTIQNFPGQVFEIEVVAVGEENGTVPSYVNAAFVHLSSPSIYLVIP